MSRDKEIITELEANNLCERLGYDFTDNRQFDNCMTNNDYIKHWNEAKGEYEFIKGGYYEDHVGTTVFLTEEEVAYLRSLLIWQDSIEPAQLEMIDNLLEKIQ